MGSRGVCNGLAVLGAGLAMALACNGGDSDRGAAERAQASAAQDSAPQAPELPPGRRADGSCEIGFEKQGDACQDIDECGGLANVCGTPLARCDNNPGAYECHCPPGYAGGGPGGIGCAPRIAVFAGATCALPFDGGVACWGTASGGVMQSSKRPEDRRTHVPPRLVSKTKDAVAVALDTNSACVLMKDGTVRCWGVNSSLVLGPQRDEVVGTPREIEGVHDVVRLFLRGAAACVIHRDLTASCWGLPYKTHVPQRIGSDVVDIAHDSSATCTLSRAGQITCQGRNGRGQQGLGHASDEDLPPHVLDTPPVVALSDLVGGAVTADGRLLWWGIEPEQDTYHRPTDLGVAEMVAYEPARRIVDRGYYPHIHVAMDRHGRVWAGVPPTKKGRVHELRQMDGLDHIVGIANSLHTCVVRDDGTPGCWGRNRDGEVTGSQSGAPAKVELTWLDKPKLIAPTKGPTP